jgi:AraC-like DNA-binding protein
MNRKETATEFYQGMIAGAAPVEACHVHRIGELDGTGPLPYRQRDFYKITLLTRGSGLLSYADRSYRIDNRAFSFSNPMIPYSWEPDQRNEQGYFCLFSAAFIPGLETAYGLGDSPLFRAGGNHVLFPNEETDAFLQSIFEQMLREGRSGYANKEAALRNYIQLLLHEGLKLDPVKPTGAGVNSAARLAGLFLELLERQFTLADPWAAVSLKKPGEFAAQLSVHVNHLNRCVKEATGKTTSDHIAQRTLHEGQALLRHTDRGIKAIAYSLGFEHLANFSLFFKKHTGVSPMDYRRQAVANA